MPGPKKPRELKSRKKVKAVKVELLPEEVEVVKRMRQLREQGLALKPERGRASKTLRILGFLFLLLILAVFILNFILPLLSIGGCIGVVSVTGPIAVSGGYGAMSSGTVIYLIQEAELRPDIRGIIIEINSPGGSVVASREVYGYLKSLEKPVIAYISETGASGGYYVAVGADEIHADPASITGSIGATALFFDMSNLLEKWGINTTTIKSGEMKDIGDLFRPMTEEEKKIVEGIVDEIFIEFKTTVEKERKDNPRFSYEKFNEILDARILTGKQAYDIGLIDRLGTRQEARSYMGEKLGLGTDPAICYIQPEKGFFESLFSSIGRGIGEAVIQNIKIETMRIS